MIYQQLTILFGFFMLLGHAEAQPQPPLNPQQAEECESFRTTYKSYLDDLHDSYRRCSHENRNEPTTRWQPGFRCSTGVRVPSACVAQSDTWACASEPYGRLVNQCLTEARANQNQFNKRLNETFEKVNTGLAAGAKDVVDPKDTEENRTKRAARQLAEWWAKETDSPNEKRLLRSALALDGYASLANDISSVLDKNNSPTERIVALTELFNKSSHPLSEEMTRASIKGVATAGTTAIDHVGKAMTQYPSSREQVLTRARMGHRLVVARERASGADGINRANEEALLGSYYREIDENIRAAEAERQALAEERARIEREHQERLAAWHRQQAYMQALEQQRRYNEYANWAQAQSNYISSFIAIAQAARRTGPSYGPAPAYRPPPRPVGGGTNCPAGMACTIR